MNRIFLAVSSIFNKSKSLLLLGATSQESKRHSPKHVVAWLSGSIAVLASALSVFAFFSTKPLPELKLVSNYESSETSCSAIRVDKQEIGKLPSLDGLTVFADLELDGSVVREVEGLSNIVERDFCGFLLANEDERYANGSIWGDLTFPDFFSLDFKQQIEIRGQDYYGDELILYTNVIVLLPTQSSEFVSVNTCEDHCFSLRGPVRIKEVWSSEGHTGFALIPVDVYQNTYLAARYECYLHTRDFESKILSPVLCAFL